MTTLNRLKKIVENNSSPQPELTISEVNKQLLLAKKAKTLGKQFSAILTIVNRYPSGSVPTDTRTDLLKYEHILELIRLIKLIRLMKPDNIVETNIALSPTIVHTEDKLKEQYQIVVENQY